MKWYFRPSKALIIAGLFLFSSKTFAQPANDQCSNAIMLTSSTSCVNTAGTNLNATYNPASLPDAQLGCGSRDKSDVWYTFVAVSTTHTITVSSAPSQVRVQLFSGTCGSFTSIACANNTITATALIPGVTYYIRVYTQNPSTGSFNICVTHAPPANDNCAGAISLTSNSSCVNTTGSLNLATANGATPLGCLAAGTYYDVWYSFIAVATTETITISNLGTNISNPQIQLYSGTCAGLASVSCGTTTITQAGLTIGNTYFVRVANLNTDPSGLGSTATFDICVTHTAPANDLCSGAIALTSGTTCINTSGTLVGATYTNIPTIGCGVASRNDVWYSFVAASSSTNITLSSAPANIRIQVFSGSCGSLTSVVCGAASLTATGLTLGATYFVRIYTDPNAISASNTFNICITHTAPPPNDDCSAATALTSATTCTNTVGTLVGANYTTIPTIGCGVANRNDVWYSFTAQSSNPTITLTTTLTNPRIQLFSGTCGALTSVACSSTGTLAASGLTIGNTYLVRIYTDPNATGTFNICITDPPPPANDNCAGAISLTSSNTCSNTAGTLIASTVSTGLPVGCEGVGSHYDVWYRFVAVATTETITISSLGAGITSSQIQLYSGTCGVLISLACHANSITQVGLTIGVTYYVRVSNVGSSPSSNGGFNICVTHTGLTNDLCSGAISITSGYTCVTTAGTTVGSTFTTAPGNCQGTNTDVWYSFVAQSSNPTITSVATSNRQRIELYSGSCVSLAFHTCGPTGNNVTSVMNPTGLIIGDTYFIRITSSTGATFTFDLCVTDPLPPANDNCSGAISLTSSTTCNNTAGTLTNATYTTIPTIGCGVASRNDVWYSFLAQSTTPTITLTTALANPRIQLFSGSCGALTSVSCASGLTLSASGLTIGNIYYVRIYTDPNVSGTFNICVTDPFPQPTNDNCSGAITLTPGSSCVNTAGTLTSATSSNPTVASTCGGTPEADVWYSFVAQNPFPTISLSGRGASFSTGYMQLLSGTCGIFTSLACVTGAGATLSITPGGTGLTVGETYYIRIYTTTIYPTASTWNFNVCVQNPGTGTTATIDYSKSYINVTKLGTGGSVEPGDILEIRATLVVRSGTVDSLAFFDTLQANKGYTLLSSTIATQTNEGKIYRAFTDAYDSDAGWYTVNGSDTIVRINLGPTASATNRGSLANNSRPSVYGGTCIIMATYRVQVYAGYDQKINWGGGAFTYRDGSNGMRLVRFKNDSLVVYISPGLCSSSLSTNNQVGLESNGTFGAPSGGTPHARNRGTSTAVPSYTYAQFSPFGAPTNGGGPNDYFYGIPNNTSATYTTSSVYNKSTLGSTIPERVFSHWDIIGDHTGATNTAKGNNPCDINQPISATNPCGYMLVVNAAYKTDTAFRSTVTNVCPNTYYEISAWVRNICYKCGCDSTGKGAASGSAGTPPAYIPFATNDSSGVPPNLAFQINGQDYYSTGNIYYTGTGPGITQSGSDTVNAWVKRGFVYKTGPTQTSFEFVIRNNAPGGGGNDWAIDDIVVASCLPIMTYSPSLLPTVCDTNTLRIYDTVRSSYENYTYYKWQRSTDNGANWTDVTGNLGPASPFWNGSAWEYVVHYDIPPSNTTLADSGDLYRMIVATTSSNLASPSCQATDVVSIITLDIIDCGILLNVDFINFNGKLVNDHATLSWSTTTENEPVHFDIERSTDGISFTRIGSVNGYNDSRSAVNHYSFIDPQAVTGKAFYRIIMVNKNSRTKQTRTIQLSKTQDQFGLVNLVNPFSNQVEFDITTPVNGKIDVALIDMVGNVVKEKSYSIYTGVNGLSLENTGSLPSGVYILQIKNKDNLISRKVIKKN